MYKEESRFLENLQYQIIQKMKLYNHIPESFKVQLKQSIEDFNKTYYQNTYKELLDEFLSIVKKR